MSCTTVAVRIALVVLLGGTAALVPLVASPASAESTYEAFAKANGADFTVSNPSIPTGLVLQGAGPEADVRQSSFGVGDANAQLPYTGETVPGLPGTAGALIGLPVPAYPFLASSTRGSEPQTVSYPGGTLRAESLDFSTLASAVGGGDGSGSSAGARIDENRDGDLTAQSLTENSSAKLGPYATLSGVRTVAKVVADGATGKLSRTTTTSIGRISVPGLVITLPPSTPGSVPGAPLPPLPTLPVPFGGQTLRDPNIGVQDGSFTVTVPTEGQPRKFAIPAAPVLAALKAVGITMTFQAPQEMKTGVISGAYRFGYTIAALPDNPVLNGPTQVTQTTGLAVASVDLAPVPAEEAPVPFFGESTDAGGPDAGVTDSSSLDSTGGGGTDGTALSAGGDSPAASGTGAEQPATAPAGPAPDLVLAGVPQFANVTIGDIYLALVAVALVGLLASASFQLMGVRSLWTS